MHDSEQEHSGITGCRVTYESTIFYNEANKFSIIVVKTNDPRIPLQACSDRYYGDRMLRFTAVGYELPRTKAVELELDGEIYGVYFPPYERPAFEAATGLKTE